MQQQQQQYTTSDEAEDKDKNNGQRKRDAPQCNTGMIDDDKTTTDGGQHKNITDKVVWVGRNEEEVIDHSKDV